MGGDYQKLIVWQRSVELVQEIYRLTSKFPSDEKFGLVSQMRRAAVSIPSNIAEGRMRGSRKDYKRFLYMAIGSGAELETQIFIAKNLGYLQESLSADRLLEETMKMLNALIRSL